MTKRERELYEVLEELKATADRLYGVANVVRREYEVASEKARAVLAKATA